MTQPVQISNIDGDLVLPLGDLLTGCFPRAGLPAEEALSSNYLGYGLSAILLSVVMLEASIGRACYDGRLTRGSPVWSSLVAHEGLEGLKEGLMEVFALRDAIVHSHLNGRSTMPKDRQTGRWWWRLNCSLGTETAS